MRNADPSGSSKTVSAANAAPIKMKIAPQRRSFRLTVMGAVRRRAAVRDLPAMPVAPARGQQKDQASAASIGVLPGRLDHRREADDLALDLGLQGSGSGVAV